MRIPFAAVLLSLGLPGGSLDAQASAPFAIDTAQARRFFREAAHTAAAGDTLWSRSLTGAILFADPVTRTLLADHPDRSGQLASYGEFFTGRLPSSENVANTAVQLGGASWAMVVWPLPHDSIERQVLLAHEMWHRIQDSLGFPAHNPANAHLASLEGRLWLRLEGRALHRALAEQGAAQRSALLDAIAFRRYRRAHSSGADSSERQLELNEGLAEYTGVAAASADPAVRRSLVGSRLAVLDTAAHFERDFAYQTGPAYGFFLDQLDPGWRSRLTPRLDLALLLARALKARTTEPVTRPAVRAARYQYAVVLHEERNRESRSRAQLAQRKQRFVRGPLLELPLAEMKLGFDPAKVEAFDSLGTIYGGLRLTDRWGVIQCDASGGLVASNWTRLIVPAPTDTAGRRLVGPGWVLELAPGWRLVPGRRAGDWKVVGIGA